MALKVVFFVAFLALVKGGIIAPAAPLIAAAPPAPLFRAAPAPVFAPAPLARAAPLSVVDAEYDPNPQYSYAYNVEDALTGDSKSHSESRNGNVVQGSYSLTDSDGTRRTVDYAADSVNGFNAVVRREPIN
ncbi:cuticle protein 19.8-like [Agrilus planipennis]|uniref:Cuticle protein 19.8-like n=1 Tax=Agrilus planipennis TaxID=224129 RepID=A0A7F5RF21_AGRPL|nr:cuticle protein 19.8-like [Agrilus planipennis]